MEITPTTIILVGVVCVILGFIASVLLNTLRDETEPPAEGTDEAPPGGKKGRYTAITRLWRERKAGSLVVEIDGKAYVSPEVLDASQRERLEQVARDLRAWLGMAGGEPPARPAYPPAAAAAADTAEDLSDIDLNRAIGAAPVAQTPTPPARSQAVQPRPQPRPTPPPTPAAGTKPAVPGSKEEPPVDVPAAKSIVMQIEDILQDQIAGTALAQRNVHLIEDPTRGVIVKVGLETYEGIDSVTDPVVRDAIRAAVQEWEKTQ